MTERLLIGVAGAFVGVIGWLIVGIVIQRRDHARRAKDAGRAVYFELGANHLAVFAAREYGVFGHLSRTTFDRLLPELSTWMAPTDLQTVAFAYLGQNSHEQLTRDPACSQQARETALDALMETHHVALDILLRTAFSKHEAQVLATTGAELFERHRQLAARVYASA